MSAVDDIRGLLGPRPIGCEFITALSCGTCSGAFDLMSAVTAVTGNGFAQFTLIWPFLLAGGAAVTAGIGLIAIGVRVSGGASTSPPKDESQHP